MKKIINNLIKIRDYENSIGETYKVKAYKNILTQLNNRPSRVIFNEYDILNEYFTNHANEHTIRCITIEHNYNENMRQKLFDLMTKHNYERKFTQLSRWDDFYLYRG